MGEGGREGRSTTDPDKVIDALLGVEAPNLTGGISTMLPNHHITKPVLIGEIQADGQFDVGVADRGSRARRRVVRLLEGSQGSDRRLGAPMKCGNFNIKTGKCGGRTDVCH